MEGWQLMGGALAQDLNLVKGGVKIRVNNGIVIHGRHTTYTVEELLEFPQITVSGSPPLQPDERKGG